MSRSRLSRRLICMIWRLAYGVAVSALLLIWSCAEFSAAESSKTICSGQVWRDTEGKVIQAHGGGILYDQRTYFWFGENKEGKTENGRLLEVVGVSCYSSQDLVKWKNEGVVLRSVRDDPSHDLHVSKVVERPKVIYNNRTRKYVMWLHVDSPDYKYARAGVAVSDRPTGPYHYVGSFRPNNSESRDMSVFQDGDGKAYLIHSSENNQTMHIVQLSEDYLRPTNKFTRNFIGKLREAPAMFKIGKKYFLITSYCTGWDPNAALYAVADSPLGPWELKTNPCIGKDAEKTFQAQSTFVLPVQRKPGTFIFMADRWNPNDLGDSRYVWLPIRLGRDDMSIPWRDCWSLGDLEK